MNTMSRPKKPGNKDLPPYVKVDRVKLKSGVKTYYKYVMPDGKTSSLGSNREEAVAAAIALNEHFNRHADLYSRVVNKHKAKRQNTIPPVGHAVAELAKRQAQKKYSDTSRDNLRQQNTQWADEWGDLRCDELTVQHISKFLNDKPYHSAVKHRTGLIELCQLMTANGWATENVADKTLKPIKPKKVRQRIEYEDLMAIREICPPWLQRGIDLALYSTQRRGDLVKMHRDMVSLADNTITVYQGKTENYDKPIYIKVDMHDELRAAVRNCLTSDIAFECPYLIAYRPKRISQQIIDAKPHLYCVTEDYFSKQFAKYRNKSGVYDHLKPDERPTLHELRSLGLHLITEKYGKEYAQALAGHSTEDMTDHYLEGHEIEPTLVSWR